MAGIGQRRGQAGAQRGDLVAAQVQPHSPGGGQVNSADGAGAPSAASPPGATSRSQHRFTRPWKAYPDPPALRAYPRVDPAQVNPAAA